MSDQLLKQMADAMTALVAHATEASTEQRQTSAALTTLAEHVAEVKANQRAMHKELAGLRHDMNSRLDAMLAMLGKHHADHEERLRRLETQVFGQGGR